MEQLEPTHKPDALHLPLKLTVIGGGVEVAGASGEGQGEALAQKLCRLDPARGELGRHAVLSLINVEHLQSTLVNPS